MHRSHVFSVSVFVARVCLTILAVFGFLGNGYGQTESVVHSFQTPQVLGDGANPQGTLIQGHSPDTNFYGTTSGGGGSGSVGTVFAMSTTGAITILHSFQGSDGAYPYGGLIQGADGNFYGTTYVGTANGGGGFFQLTPAGVFTLLYSFGASSTDGRNPLAGVIQASDGNFYGVCQGGGASDRGAIFKAVVTTSGGTSSAAVSILYSFGAISNDGENPDCSLMQGSDGYLYGATEYGGSGGNGPHYGTLFKIALSGTSYAILHNFGTVTGDGVFPHSKLYEDDNGNFYGATEGNSFSTADGEVHGPSVIYTLTSAGGFAMLNTFVGGDSFVYSGFIAGGSSNLYATCSRGGASGADGNGFIFEMSIAPSTLGQISILHYFNNIDGAFPFASLVKGADGSFYGTASGGGTPATVPGTVFKVTSSGTFTVLHTFQQPALYGDGSNPTSSGLLTASSGLVYGTTHDGGSAGWGSLFSMDSSGNISILHSFGDGSIANDGKYPANDTLIEGSTGIIYGTTSGGGSSTGQWGTVFKVTPTGTLSVLHVFGDGSVTNDGLVPEAGLALLGGYLYGTTEAGGLAGEGTVFKINSSGTLTILHSFAGTDGSAPIGGLFAATDGNLYGATSTGGTAGYGTLFEITPSGTLTTLHHFGDGGISYDGRTPATRPYVTISGSIAEIVGTTSSGGANNEGFLYNFGYTGGALEIAANSYSFGGFSGDAGFPAGALTLDSSGNYFGTTAGGGTKGNGTLFRWYPYATSPSISILHNFDASTGDGVSPEGIVTANGNGIFGMTIQGGSQGKGTIYQVTALPQTLTFPSISDQTYTTTPFALNGSASSGLPVYYTKSGPVTISGNNATITGVGSVSIRAHQDGNGEYAASTTVLRTFNVTQASQTITFPTIPDQTSPYSPIALNATASSGLAITYTHTGPVTISGNTATITGAGSIRIRASQDGNTNYSAATSVLNTFTAH